MTMMLVVISGMTCFTSIRSYMPNDTRHVKAAVHAYHSYGNDTCYIGIAKSTWFGLHKLLRTGKRNCIRLFFYGQHIYAEYYGNEQSSIVQLCDDLSRAWHRPVEAIVTIVPESERIFQGF
jgi:hypothetical protein